MAMSLSFCDEKKGTHHLQSQSHHGIAHEKHLHHRKTDPTLSVSSAQKAMISALAEKLITGTIDSATSHEDQEWELSKSKCSFCQYFLGSPCKTQFTKWSKCVDMAKEHKVDYISVCSKYTDALMTCTTANAKYFEEVKEADQAEKGKDADQ